ncbi:11505_t:CDS:10 [Diversispora eburnea]|uniref:11505_t:CDS:1 n=1 Tax=Diversispora eburnea TaxID=1213867 RepID=A0A9N8YM06_9GLOM|nr:11505_t:CDS:10 [Diversispora eburnea]
MSSEESNNFKRRRVARACDTCRRKKVRCDGVQPGSDPPSCTNCKAYGYECSFIDAPKKRGPPKGYIEALETRLQRMESILGGLVQSGDLPEGTINSNLEWINVNENDGLSSDSNEYNGSQYDLNDSMGQLAIDEKGHTRYLGNSSGIFLLKFTKKITHGQMITVPRGEWHTPSTRRIAAPDMTLELPPKELCDLLLDTFWREIHPYMPFIDKQDFMEKYNNLETNYTHIILLYAMFAVAARFVDNPAVRSDPDAPSTAGTEYFEKAKELLKDEFDNATIPTIQALLILTGHQQGAKNSTTWLYSGLATRLAQDMGLHRDSAKWNLDDRQSEVRRRVWWSCVVVDRCVSAALGRVYFDVHLPVTGILSDDPPNSVKGFVEMIKIITILGRVLSHIYGIKATKTLNGNNDSVLATLDAELNEWHDNIPQEFKYDSTMSFGDIESNRKMFMHLIYYTVQILLHRPHIRGPKSKAPPSSIPSLTICTMAANNITHILYRSMKDGSLRVNWNYAAFPFFTAATMHIINALSGDDRFREVAKHGLRMTLKCLEFLKPYWFATEKVILIFNELIADKNINLYGINDLQNKSSKKFVNIEDMICGLHDSSSSSLDMPRVTFAPSPPLSNTSHASPRESPQQTQHNSHTIQEYNIAMRQQQQQMVDINNVNHYNDSSITMNYDQSNSPESTTSSSGSGFMQFNNNEFNISDISPNNSLFVPNADAFSSDVSSLLFDGDDPMGDNNPFLSLPSAIDWTEKMEVDSRPTSGSSSRESSTSSGGFSSHNTSSSKSSILLAHQNGRNGLIRCYGITQHPETKDYAIVIRCIETDLKSFLYKDQPFPEYDWKTKLEIISNIAFTLQRIHDSAEEVSLWVQWWLDVCNEPSSDIAEEFHIADNERKFKEGITWIHPEAVYHRRHLDFPSLPDPENFSSETYYKMVSFCARIQLDSKDIFGI